MIVTDPSSILHERSTESLEHLEDQHPHLNRAQAQRLQFSSVIKEILRE